MLMQRYKIENMTASRIRDAMEHKKRTFYRIT
jgi:hypothetical protein